ncbi:MarR family transcriptional regulator [Leptolinea sp. HRD-7]|nr:MarR family transcriptional regulator [Leptolinea sp. HRD-7]
MEDHRQLGKLLFSIGRLQATRADRYMDQIGLFRGQGMLLKFLDHHDGLTHSEIAERLEISPAAVTKVIKRLEEQKYLKRQPDPKDERVSRVFIQPAGKKVADDIRNLFIKLDDCMFEGFSEAELEMLYSFLVRMQANLQQDETYGKNKP